MVSKKNWILLCEFMNILTLNIFERAMFEFHLTLLLVAFWDCGI